jgi:ATP-binding protein involved in chromosome partitioning
MPTEFMLLERLRNLRDPEFGRTFADLNLVRSAVLGPQNAVTVQLELPTPAYPQRERLSDAIRQALSGVPELGPIDVQFTTVVKGKNTGGAIGLRIKNVVAVGSGKGGVGKSTVAASIAYGLKTLGAAVGLMDADVYGPSIPHLVGGGGTPSMRRITDTNGETVDRLVPIEVDGLKVISMGYFVKPDQAIIFRGPRLHGAITQLLKDTDWGELDYLIIDLPPGTGDVSLTLSQMLGLAGAIVVCTPQQVALLDAVKAISMFRQVKIPVLGMVENMTGEVFGRGGAREKAAELGLPFLGEIPLDAQIRMRGDEGRLGSLFADDSPARPHLLHICEQAALQIARSLLETPSLPTLEIL